MTPAELKHLIETGIPGAQAMVDGDGTHFQAIVISQAFRGLTMVKKHQLVYQALGDRMQSEVHALSIKTLTPEEWELARKPQVLPG
jgi:acid stress-induced BolA-like protein IbaG/YrbA